ncbi:low affinity immunoglobulin epsilon Fc receptor-like [Saccoglossus kowalevskii]|uniref:Low affinity immunoglobulin epsilon Fc receptor-like n=1 Tax=Saccoglossus kowalevskii TaxID=10224 RepID=A0ABM0GXP2_SACKO|nr:PREDICTED: low affinity immunoglobulin epsilon Fc receptor-like [Saccoglossus kowalevskii]
MMGPNKLSIVFVLAVVFSEIYLGECWRRRRSSCSPEDCTVGQWGPWSSCSAPCGTSGTMSRTRDIVTAAQCGGSCSFSLTDSQSCNVGGCNGNGVPLAESCDCNGGWSGTCCDQGENVNRLTQYCKYYDVHSDEVNYASAESTCASGGGELAVLNTQPKFQSVRKFIVDNNLDDNVQKGFWFGLDDRDNEGSFVWSDGSAVSAGFTKWASGQPNNNVQLSSDGQDCVSMWKEAFLTWDDTYCTQIRGFICEIDAGCK